MFGAFDGKKELSVPAFRPDSVCYRLIKWLILHLFPPVFRLLYGWRVIGEIPVEAMKGGAVSVCNHVHTLDCVMLACAFREYQMQFLTLPSNLRLPVAGSIVKLMGGLGLPESPGGWRDVYGRVERAFADGQVLQIYPEGELISGCRQLREFKPGAFHFAAKYKKPVIPCILRFYPRYGKSGGRIRDGLELVILPAVYPAREQKGKAAAEELQRQVQEKMQQALRTVNLSG